MSHSDPGCHLASLQAVAREEASQVCLLPEAVYLCTEATAATLRQTHTSGMQVSGLVVEQVFKMWAQHNWVSEFSFQVSNDHLITSSIHPVYIWLDLLV